jgi:hypothetical protein
MKTSPPSSQMHQRGVVLLFTLIILVILLGGAVAVIRSMNTSLSSAGNLAFKRDLMNQGEQAVSSVMTVFKTGALSGTGATATSLQSANYSATPLATNARGIPLALLSDAAFTAVGTTANDLLGATPDVAIRYVVDQLCDGSAAALAVQSSGCVFVISGSEVMGGSSQAMGNRPPLPPSLVYRLNVRVTGPRNTQVFIQTSFTKPV